MGRQDKTADFDDYSEDGQCRQIWTHKVIDSYQEDRVVFIIDECHRTQFGEMHKADPQAL